MVLSMLIYRPIESSVVAWSTIWFLALISLGWMETRGKHIQYSKFRANTSNKKVRSKVGMLISYAPPFLVGLSSFYLLSDIGDRRLTLLRSTSTIHFFKRLFEVLFVHKYSGWMDLEAMITICFCYFWYSVLIIYNQYLAQALPEPAIDLKYVGLLIFLVGIAGNFYHHYLLSKLRTNKGEKEQYKIPQGGLFGLVICPHYLFEIVGFIGIACISQTLLSTTNLVGMTLYLMARSYATRKWYRSKFEDFPEDVKAVFPYIF